MSSEHTSKRSTNRRQPRWPSFVRWSATLAAIGASALLGVGPSAALASVNTNWAAGVTAPLPTGGGDPTVVNSVSCWSAGNCGAVGNYTDASGNGQGLLLSETAGAWATGVEASLPNNAGTDPSVSLSSVSCATTGNCSAVGTYTDSTGNQQGVLLTETAGTWTSGVEASLPDNAGTDPSVSLSSVSCASAGNCSAVGTYTDSTGEQQGLLLTETSGTWATGVEALPASTDLDLGVTVSSVSCASAGNCIAVGSNVAAGLMWTETSGKWASAETATLPANAAFVSLVELNSVSCASAENCAAVGDYTDGNGDAHTLLVSETSGAWQTGVEATLPQDADPTQSLDLTWVSCPSAGNCSAVGYYTDSDDNQQALLLSEQSGTWSSGLEASLPPGADPTNVTAQPNEVSCWSAGNCSAVGYYLDGSGNPHGLLLTQAAGVWQTGADVSLPADASPLDPSSGLFSVSCAAAGSCSAVGAYGTATPAESGMEMTAAPAHPAVALSAPATEIMGGSITSVDAVLSSGAQPSGTITFEAFGPQASPPASCASGGTPVGNTTVSDNGTYEPSSGFTPSAVGTYWWYASYAGDAGDAAAASTCGSGMASTVVSKATTTLTAAAPASGVAGSTIAASAIDASLAGAVSSATGTVTFRAFGPQTSAPSSCASGGTPIGSANVSHGGTYHPSAGFTPETAGTYWWYAGYGGDADDTSAASTCGPSMTHTVIAAAKSPAPRILRAKLSSARFGAKRGTTLTLTLTSAAKVKVVIVPTQKGHRRVAARTIALTGAAGANSFKLKLSGLGRGNYMATITARNASGIAAAVALRFTITHA